MSKCKFEGVRQRGNTYEWRAQYKGEKANKGSYDTPEEAYIARKDWMDEAKRGYAQKPQKIKSLVEVWEEAAMELSAVSSTTRRLSNLEQHIKPYFKTRLITSITAGDIEKFLLSLGNQTLDKKFGKPIWYSQEYINGFYKGFSSTMEYAVKHNYIPAYKNPVDLVNKKGAWTKCGRPKEDGEFLSPAQLKVIGDKLITTDLYASFMIGLHAGARISEIFGLRWCDIDFERNEIHFNKQFTYFDKDKDGNVYKMWKLSPLKSKNADRYVPMTKELREYLLKLKDVQEANKKKLGSNYRDKQKVVLFEADDGTFHKVYVTDFVNIKDTGEFLTTASTSYATRDREDTTGKYKYWLDENDKNTAFHFTYHDFRHTYATLLVLSGMPCEELQLLMGHSKIETSKKFYLHDKHGKLRVNPKRDSFLFDAFSTLTEDINQGKDAHTCEIIEGVDMSNRKNTSNIPNNEDVEEIPVLSDIVSTFKNGVGILRK